MSTNEEKKMNDESVIENEKTGSMDEKVELHDVVDPAPEFHTIKAEPLTPPQYGRIISGVLTTADDNNIENLNRLYTVNKMLKVLEKSDNLSVSELTMVETIRGLVKKVRKNY